ncbi:hypothetical protein ORI20_27635 [Mycobacterium sp. CVI_P3]|uniref:Uncharacterized protein n=1 Tax=Mycobacterium pinniadriaticum TaxID=2994102 RepID=A0ABT3SLQ6_9MYCO|nr:hypothetical protein [Mycobacterium pinniadriaticum]MCX2934045.1 hypothetical protein [Mycobacterium pinniadriaticum]MCX2940458.1 hypothetical protein [Mycobacterium pinniadriaticum]
MSPAVERRSLADGLRMTKKALHEGMAAAESRADDVAVLGYSREIRSTTSLLAKIEGLHAPEEVNVNVTLRPAAEILADYEAQLLAAIDAEVVEIEH